MNTRNVIGQKIVAVKQSRIKLHNRSRSVITVDYVELENGVRLIPIGLESEIEPVGDLTANHVKRKRGGAPMTQGKRDNSGAMNARDSVPKRPSTATGVPAEGEDILRKIQVADACAFMCNGLRAVMGTLEAQQKAKGRAEGEWNYGYACAMEDAVKSINSFIEEIDGQPIPASVETEAGEETKRD